MAFRKVSSGKFKYVKYADCKVGQVLAEGHYLGAREGKFGIQHQIQEGDAVTVLNSSGHLNWLIENNVGRGDMIRVVYAGLERLEKGRFKNKEAHRFELEVDDAGKTNVKGTVNEENDDEDEESSEEVANTNSGGSSRSGGLASRYTSSRSNVSSALRNSKGDAGSARSTARSEEVDEESKDQEKDEKDDEKEGGEEKRLKEAQDVITKYRTRRA